MPSDVPNGTGPETADVLAAWRRAVARELATIAGAREQVLLDGGWLPVDELRGIRRRRRWRRWLVAVEVTALLAALLVTAAAPGVLLAMMAGLGA